MTKENPAHGTTARYHGKLRCRCPECKAAQAEHMREYKARRLADAGPNHDFHGTSTGYFTLGCRCIECRDWQTWYHRDKLYGVTKEQVTQIWEDNNRECPLCLNPLPFDGIVVDHDHVTLKFRGVLCMNCNFGLGSLYDSVETLQRAIEYLEEQHA